MDLDGTLLRDRGGDSHPQDMEALHAAQAAGIPVIIATGRSHFASQPVVDRLGLQSPHAPYDGAWIVSPDGKLERDVRVPLDMARHVLRECRNLGLAVRVFLSDRIIISEEPGPDEVFFKYRPYEHVDRKIADTLREPPVQMVVVHLNDVSAFAGEFTGTDVEHDLQWMLQGHDPETPHFWALHLLNKAGTKEGALAQLCERWGVERENVLAFGDGPNDVGMLGWAGTGVSFPWAVEEAQAAANIITDGADPHPIATVVRAWLASPLPVS